MGRVRKIGGMIPEDKKGTDNIKKIIHCIRYDLYSMAFPIILIIVILLTMELVFGEVCPVKILLGIPCPGCGLTHACIYILTFRWKLAWEWNPAAFLWVPSILFWFINRYVLKRYEVWVRGAFIVTCIATMIRYMIVMTNTMKF